MADEEDYEDWEDWHKMPGLKNNRASDGYSNRRKLRRNPSPEDKAIRKRDRRTASEEANDRGDLVAQNRADIIRQITKAATLDEQLRLVAVLDEFDRNQALRAQASRSIDLDDTVSERLTPVRVHEHHTAATDWLGGIDDVPSDWHQKVAAEAAVWYQNRPDFVKADREEFGIQAQSKAHQVAGAYGLKAEAAARTFLSYVAFLHTGASGLDQIQQTVAPDGVTQKSTPLPAEVFDNFAPDIDPINQGVSGTESSTRNPLLNEIAGGGSGMDSGSPEKPGGHSTSDDLSWSPPSGMQNDSTPPAGNGAAEDEDQHNTGFGSDSEFSKHTSMWHYAGEEGLDHQNSYSTGPDSSGSPFDAPKPDLGSVQPSKPRGGPLGIGDAGKDGGLPISPKPGIEGEHHGPPVIGTPEWGRLIHGGSRIDAYDYDQVSPAIGYVFNMDDFRAMQAQASFAGGTNPLGPGLSCKKCGSTSKENKVSPGLKCNNCGTVGGGQGKADGRSSGRHASSTEGKNAADDVESAEEKAQAELDDPALKNLDKEARSYDGFKPHPEMHRVTDDEAKKRLHDKGLDGGRPAHEYPGHADYNEEERHDHEHGLAAVGGLFYDAASGLDQIDQVIDANNVPKRTGYPTDVAFPLNDPFQPEYSTHGTGTVSEGQENPQPNPQHQSTPAKTSGLTSREAAILQKVADMYGGSDLAHKVLNPVPNNAGTTPEEPTGSGGKGAGSKAAGDPNQKPTFSDDSSHVPPYAQQYAEGYADKAGNNEPPKNVPASVAGPGKAVTHAGSLSTTADDRNDNRVTRGLQDYHKGTCESCHGSGVWSDGRNTHGLCKSCGGSGAHSRRGNDKATHQNGYGDSVDDYGRRTREKTSHLISTAADREDPEFMKGYLYVSKWNMNTPIVTEGSSSFEAGIYAGLTDYPSVRNFFVEACKTRGQGERIRRHASITQSLAQQLGVKVASTSLYLDTAAPNTSPSADGSTPINGRGRPGPLDGKETGEEGPGGPAPYNGAAPHGHGVVPGAHALEQPGPTDHLMPDSGYTTPRAVEKASAFRRRVQAGLLREGKN